MSQETPCLPGCRCRCGYLKDHPVHDNPEPEREFAADGIGTHALGCPNAPAEPPNAPKAEATPANVSEPPIDFFDAIRVWTPLDPKHSVLKGHAMSAHLALKDQNAAQEAELAYLKQGIPLSYNPNAMCRNGHEMVLFKSVDEHCPMCAITAEVERLMDLIVAQSPTNWAYHPVACCCVFCEERRAILADRAKGEKL